MKRISTAFFFVLVFLTLFVGCKRNNGSIARIWTDQSEFAAYVELFNLSQTRHRIIVEYKENPSEALINTRNNPDIVIGAWLKGEKARAHIIPIEYLFNELRINTRLFYQPLLELGSIKRRQYLLPVSFNLPAMLFSLDKSDLMENNFSLSLDHIQSLSREFNTKQEGLYTRMGFSPRWSSEFLYLIAQMFSSRFEEGQNILTWNEKDLSTSIDYLRNWSRSINESIRSEDDFQFRFLYDPPYRLVTSGRNLFSYISSDELCVLPQDKLQNIDFRWLMKDSAIPVRDDIVYLGICKKAENLPAAEAFVVWFFKEETQKILLERSKEMGILDQSFGISGGFSSIQTVNEKIFPLFYPLLFGHLPSQDSLEVPSILPNNWEQIKDYVVIPFFEAAVTVDPPMKNPNQDLKNRLSDWRKKF